MPLRDRHLGAHRDHEGVGEDEVRDAHVGVLLVDLAQGEDAQSEVRALDVDPRSCVLAQHAGHRDIGVCRVGAELPAVGVAGGILVLVEAVQVRGVRRIDADLQRLQPVALDQALEREGMGRGREEQVELGKGRGLAVAQPAEHDAVLDDHRVALLANLPAKRAALGLGRRLEALAVDIEQPAVEQAAQAAILQPPEGEIGAAMGAIAIEQAVPATLVSEQHEVLAQEPYRLDGALVGQLVDQRHRVPVVPHQGAAPGTGADPRDQLVLLATHHARRVAQTAGTVIRGQAARGFSPDDGKSRGVA